MLDINKLSIGDVVYHVGMPEDKAIITGIFYCGICVMWDDGSTREIDEIYFKDFDLVGCNLRIELELLLNKLKEM